MKIIKMLHFDCLGTVVLPKKNGRRVEITLLFKLIRITFNYCKFIWINHRRFYRRKNSVVSMAMHVRPRKKKGLSHEPARISMWTHFCRISLCAEPNFWLFFFFFSCQEKNDKNWPRSDKKKKKVGQKHYKKRIPAFRIAHFLKKKKSHST